MKALDRLVSWFDGKQSVLVALSGGVDSALVAYAASESLHDSAVAVTADYRTLSSDELGSARRVASEIGMRHIVISYDELENNSFAKNDNRRCFYCRSELASHLQGIARSEQIARIVDGTNADDLGDYRPGIEAMHDGGIQSPLAALGMGKRQVRAVAKHAGLSVHDRPSNSCLASRIPWGTAVTVERLVRIDLAERFVRQTCGVGQVRVRDIDGTARIEVMPGDITCVQKDLDILGRQFETIGFSSLLVDPEGYSPGKANVVAD